MTRRLLFFSLLSLFFLNLLGLSGPATCCFAADSEEAPLTLLKKPDNSGQASQLPGLPGQSLSMQGSPSQPEKLRDIHGPVPIVEPPPYLLLAGIFVLVLLLAALFYWWWKKREKPAAPPIPPWEKALLDLADARRFLNPERGLQYMDRASQILRRYIESRFAIKSTRQTTREFLHSLTGEGENIALKQHKTELRACLEQADMAKFAHHIPGLSNLEKMEEAVTSFIKTTEPIATDPKSEGPKKTKQSKQSKQYRGGRT